MDYIVIRKDDELMHYGVKGMRWGIRKATKQLSTATTTSERDKAVATLEKHRAKASKQVTKLEKKHPKLEKTVETKIIRNDVKAAKLSDKAATKRNKAYRRFISEKKASKLLYKANKLQAQADYLAVKSKKAKAELAKNEELQKIFKKGINDIDTVLVDKGRKFING